MPQVATHTARTNDKRILECFLIMCETLSIIIFIVTQPRMENYENPLDFVRQCIGTRLTVRLRNKATLRGELVGYDDHLNMMVKDATLRRGNKAE